MTNDPYNAAEKTDVRHAVRLSRQVEREDEDVVRSIMRDALGRGWMYRKLSACNVHQTTFTGDALRSAFLEGQRNVGLLLTAEVLRTCPDEYIQMLREANDRAIISDITRRNASNGNGSANPDGNYVNYAPDYNPVDAADRDEA